jgi:membrane-associated phospholipid phosphatase
MPATAPLSFPATAPVQRRVGLGLLAAGAWSVFGSMATLVYRYRLAPFDEPVLHWLHRHATPALDWLALQLTTWGNTGPMIAAGVLSTVALVRTGRRRAAWLFVAGLGGSMLLTQMIKAVATRPRPALWLSLRPEHTFSFPSGHAMDTAAFAAALFFALPPRWRGWWLLAPLFALAVGWARMYLGVHYPSDVLAGWSSAVGWVLLVQLVAARFAPTSAATPQVLG